MGVTWPDTVPNATPTGTVRYLLWADCTAAALAGVAVLALSGWLDGLYGLPRGLLLLIGSVNLLYACYSFALATRSRRTPAMLHLLIAANLGWAMVCLALAARFAGDASLFGLAHLVGEAGFVGGLAALEWKWRDLLVAVGSPMVDLPPSPQDPS